MIRKIKIIPLLSIVLLSAFLLNPPKIFADISEMSIATVNPVEDEKAIGGDIVSLGGKNGILTLTKVEYDENMYGVIVDYPQILLKTQESGKPVVRNGEVFVNVTTLSGPVEIGDYITSSQIPGKGQKAQSFTSGYMLGKAVSAFNPTPAEAEEIEFGKKKVFLGRVKVAVGIGPASPVIIKASGGLFGTLKQLSASFLFNLTSTRFTEKLARYIVASIVALTTIFISLHTFGRAVTKGIESIGRNPLAKISIQTMIVLNVILIAVVSLGGIALALAILSL